MGQEGEASRICDSVDEPLWLGCKRGELSAGFKDQQVVFLGFARLIVHFLACKEQNAFISKESIAVRTIHPNVVVGDDDEVQASTQCAAGNIFKRSRAVRIVGVRV